MRVLILVDFQRDFVTGSLGTDAAKAIIPKVKDRIELYRKAGFQIIFTEDLHDESYFNTQEGRNLLTPHCMSGTTGRLLVDGLRRPGDKVIKKSNFAYSGWKSVFDVKQQETYAIEIAGLCTDTSVISNAIALKTLMPEAKVMVNYECCAGTTPEKHKAAIAVMQSCQIYAPDC